MKDKDRVKTTSIGGQAVMEGVMMRGPSSQAVAVRNPQGQIVITSERFRPLKERSVIYRIPILRGVCSFAITLISGTKTLMKSADVYGSIEAEPTKFEKWLAEKSKVDVMDMAVFIGAILGVALSIGLFFILPTLGLRGLEALFDMGGVHYILINLIEGAIRIAIFVGYILLVSLMNDIKRVFMYHGAEHKTISCYERGLDLTVENARKMSTVHDRCGTTFMFIIMVVSILVFSLFGKQDVLWIRIGLRLLMLPVVAGVSYELLKLFAKSNNIFFRICKAPGLLLQKLTTKEPTDDMLEVAIASFKTVMALEADSTLPVKAEFDKNLVTVYPTLKSECADKGIETADLDWIICYVCALQRSELTRKDILITAEQEKEIHRLFDLRKGGQPVQYILGDTQFYGYEIKVDKRVLIPRADTECVVERALEVINAQAESNANLRVLDLCCGSGAIAIAIAKQTNATVFAADVSAEALELAKENAAANSASVTFLQSDMLTEVSGEFNVIVCNPPYISKAELEKLSPLVKDNEPLLALDGGEDGLDFYRTLAATAPSHLSPSAALVMEIGSTQAEAVSALFKQGFATVEVFKDLSGLDRCIVATLGNL